MQAAKAVLRFQLAETLDNLLLEAVELIAALREIPGAQLIFEPDPLKERRFI